MSREWQQTRMLEYVMPNAVYYQTLWAVRDLERMESRLKELTRQRMKQKNGSSLANDPVQLYIRYRQNTTVDNQAMETAILTERVDAIHRAMREVPPRYRGVVINNIVHKSAVDIYEDSEWKLWKQKFLFMVARNLSIM